MKLRTSENNNRKSTRTFVANAIDVKGKILGRKHRVMLGNKTFIKGNQEEKYLKHLESIFVVKI